ncbi:MAG: phosphotyrosine protein phosphatase [Caulobacteraceae bacterium]|nr:phosphotyrosine protein phosphatase [Caulobacteraceae bacterium]
MSRLPRSVLFVCNLNRVRSPMAAGLTRRLYGDAILVESCGLEPSDGIDPMVVAAMQEVGVDLIDHQPKGFAEFSPAAFDLIVALSEEAWPPVEAAGAAGEAQAAHWPTEDPTTGEGSREMRLEAYRVARRSLEAHIVDRFGPPPEWE